MHKDATKDILRTVLQYIKQVRNVTGSGPDPDPLAINLDSEGFPIIPKPDSSWTKVTKGNLEKLYRSYLTHHYSTYIQHSPVILINF